MAPPHPPRAPATRFRDVSDPTALALLASPVRQDIVDTLSSLGGEADVATVAAELGRPADGLYYHFDRLAEAGLLTRREDCSGTRRYRIGEAPGTTLRLVYGRQEGAGEAVQAVVGRLLQAAGRDFRGALARPDTRTAGPGRELWAGRTRGWLDEEGLREANALLERLQALLRGPRKPGRDHLVSLSFVLAPLRGEPLRRGRKRG